MSTDVASTATNPTANAATAPTNPTVPAPTTTVVAVPATFVPALTPGGANQSPLDFNNRPEHVKLYLASTKALDTKYNGKLEHLRTFLANVERRVDEFGWSNICMIGNRYLFREHGLITQQELETAANSYATTPITRSAQNAQAMYEFLMNSVDQDLTAKLVNCTDLYKFGDRSNGPALLKTIISYKFKVLHKVLHNNLRL
jgi:hypothetical protein